MVFFKTVKKIAHLTVKEIAQFTLINLIPSFIELDTNIFLENIKNIEATIL